VWLVADLQKWYPYVDDQDWQPERSRQEQKCNYQTGFFHPSSLRVQAK
jgi:hypothetical protein